VAPMILFTFVPTILVCARACARSVWCFNVCCCDRAGVHLLPRAPCPRHRWSVVSCPYPSAIGF
jgi:hypothetical protein